MKYKYEIYVLLEINLCGDHWIDIRGIKAVVDKEANEFFEGNGVNRMFSVNLRGEYETDETDVSKVKKEIYEKIRNELDFGVVLFGKRIRARVLDVGALYDKVEVIE